MAKRPVKSQMPSAKVSLTGTAGTYDHNPNGPFGAPHDVGGGGIPLKFQDSLTGKAAVKVPPHPFVGQTEFPKRGGSKR